MSKPTQLDEFHSILADIPGDSAFWIALSARLERLRRHSDPQYKGPERDGSIDEMTWGHVRNASRYIREMAQGFAALERGDDPDIPF